MDVTSTALSGLRAAATEFKTAATNIANADTEGFKADKVERSAVPQGGVTTEVVKTDEPVELAEQLVNTDIATYNFQANLKVLQKQQELDKSLLDIQA